MNGNSNANMKYLLDTNCIIELLQNENFQLLKRLENADWIGISIITIIEFLSFSRLKKVDKDLFTDLIKMIEVVDLKNENSELIDYTTSIRKKNKIKLPDSIILATAKIYDSILLTNDKKLHKIKDIQVDNF